MFACMYVCVCACMHRLLDDFMQCNAVFFDPDRVGAFEKKKKQMERRKKWAVRAFIIK